MKRYTLTTIIAILLILTSGAVAAREADDEPARPASQVIIEGAYIQPAGDLSGDFPGAERGFGAKAGFEAGFRWRYFLTRSLSISPAFHFENFGAREGENGDEVGEWSIKSTSYRYTLELMVLEPGPETRVRPFLAAAWGVYRNRVEGFQQNFNKEFDSSVNTLGLSFRLGARFRGFELSLLYSFNRFHTWRFFDTGYEEVYFWDNMAFRLGWQLPFGEG